MYGEKMAGRLLTPSKTPASPRRSLALFLVPSCLVALMVASSASADPRTEFFIKQLKTSDDFKVRTQAALALGASGDTAAVAPLCGGLGDANNSVKVAAAAALGKLGKGEGAGCLKTAKKQEKDSSVIAQIDQSLQKLAGGGGDDPPAIGGETKFYVAIQVTNKTTRSDGEIDRVVRGAAQARILNATGYAVAPRSESTSKAAELLKGNKKLKGLLLITSIDTPVYSGGKVSISVNSTIWTYPDKSLKATINAKRSTEAAGTSDVEGENLLIQAASEDAALKLIAAAAKL